MTWTDVDRVARALGDPAAAADEYLADCVAAADDWARRKRLEAGYVDTDPPAAAVAKGTTLYAVALYRERGSSDSFASFEDLPATRRPARWVRSSGYLASAGPPSTGPRPTPT